MGKTVLLVTLGNSDLAIEGKTLERSKFRTLCNEIKSTYDAVRESLSLPLLDPYILKVRELLGGRRLDLIYLFYTLQDPPQEKDTDIAAEIISRLICERYRDQVGSIKRHHLRASPPHFGEVFHFFYEFFERLKSELASWERCFLGVTGGTPAMSAGLIFVGVMKLRDRVDVLYVPRGISEAFRLDVPSRLLYLTGKEEIISACRRRDYATALEILRFTPGLPHAREAELLLTVAHYRFLRDFDHALSALNEAQSLVIKKFPPPQAYSSWRNSLSRLAGEPSPQLLLAEVFYYSSAMLQRGAFASFLSGLFSLLDGILGWELELATEGAVLLNRGEWERREALKEWLKNRPDVEGWLRKNDPDLDPSLGPNQRVTASLLRALGQLHHDPETRRLCQKVAGLAGELEPLRDLRNRITHRFEGASQERIEERYPGGPGSALGKVREVLLELGVPVGVDPYDEWNRWLEEWL